MPKVLVTSDSHGLTEELEMIKARHKDEVEIMIHCGDSELDFDEGPMNDFMKVSGNCDFDSRYPDELDFSVGDLKFFVTHGHLHQVKTSLMPVSYRAEELGATIICHGHSHIAVAQKVKNQVIINPGSIRLPRVRKEKTYAILSWESNNQITVDFYDVDGHAVKDLAFQTTLE
ncbi:putative metallophosphoesterase YsnB [Paraliobacillus quinghaiensis]|uniref:Phosphoesterase n=1 Tax=Paraliobacillus quinghaiensis TaxID=470815 RepID=A0A917WTD4_9BACI|nr:metallophosphoesterase [Paraliobacillus quinghaiensis]GGM27075.1 putative metallophosphoesterase YsnB [Paraliobacillus quinghaiensis]